MTGSEGKRANPVFNVLGYLGAAVVLLLAAMTVIDVGGRYLFNSPLKGAFEMTGLMLAVIAACGIAVTTADNQHIKVDLVFDRLSSSQQRILLFVSASISVGIFAILTWQGSIAVRDSLVPYIETSPGTVAIVAAPFRFMLALGFFLSAVASGSQLFNLLRHRGNSPTTGQS